MKSTLEKSPLQTVSTKIQDMVSVEIAIHSPESIDVLAIIFSGTGKFENAASKWSDEVLAREINTQALHAKGFCEAAIENSKSGLLYAWACGILLNAAKARLGYGHFGKWRQQILNEEVICERTSQRYMLLAANYPDVEALLIEDSSLRQAQIACGPLSETAKIAKTDSKNVEKTQKKSLFSSVTRYRKSLGRFADLKGRLGEDEKQQLRRAKAEIDELFGTILE